MDNSTPYINVPLSVQHSPAHKGNDAQQMASTASQGLLHFLPTFHNTDKGSMDLHGFNVAPSENIHAEDLHSSFKMNENCNLIFDPFSTDQQLSSGTLTVRHDLMHNNKHSSINDFTSTNSNVQPCSTIELPNCLETSLASHRPHEQQISLSSHIFSKTLENSLSESLDFHSSLTHVPLESGLSFQEVERSIPPAADDNHCDENIGIQDFNPPSVTHSVDQNLDSIEKVTCDTCDHTFTSESDLVNHKTLVHGTSQEKRNEYTFTCTFCPKAFRTEEQLAKHEARHPYKTSAIQCSKCGEILGNYMLLQEHKQSEDYLSSCDLCGQLFPNEECMICHIRNAHNDFEDFVEEEGNTSQRQEEPTTSSVEDTFTHQGCLPEDMPMDVNPQPNILCQEPSADTGFVDEERPTAICQESSLELSYSSVQNESLTQPVALLDQSRDDESFTVQEKCLDFSNELDTSNSEPFAESSVLETDTVCPEDVQDRGTACEGEGQAPNDDNGSVSDASEPEKMQCRYCSKKCSTRKSLIRHERCHPYETAAMKCNLCLEVVDCYKLLKIHKKKLAQVACSTCNQLCPNELCLLCHVRNVHNNSVYDVKPIYSVSDDSNDAYNYEDEDASDDDGGQQFSLPRYATRNSEGPLRITIKQEKEDYDEQADSPTFSAPTPPTPLTPSPQGPPTPSPPPFIPESEPSEEDEDDDEYEPNASDDSAGRQGGKASKRKSSLRTTRRSSFNSVQLSSSEGSDRGESSDNYSPEGSVSEEDSDEDAEADWGQERSSPGSKKKTRRKNPISDNDSEEDPDWRRARSTSAGPKKKGRRKKGPLSDDSDDDVGWRPAKKSSVSSRKKAQKKKSALSDDDSDNDPDWRKAEIAPVLVKKKRGRPKKVQVAFFVPAIPMPKRPRAKGLGGKKAHDAAAALAQAVEDMETTVPELKTVIRPVRRSVTKASHIQYCEIEDDEYDYLLHVKQEPKAVVEGSEHAQIDPQEMSESVHHVSNEIPQLSSGNQSLDQEEEEEEEEVVIKAEPYDFQEDEDESTDLYFSQKFCEPKFEKKGSKKRDLGEGEVIKREGYACKLCGRGMQYRSHLIRHLRKVHDGEGIEEVMRRMMHCRFCSKPYTNELSLINHEKLHDGTSKMKCNKCEERFDDKNALRRHQRKTHWEHQPVECEICQKQLSDNTCLKAHMKHMHGTEEKKVTIFTCETCGRQLHTKTAFQNHVASKCGTNLLFPCETCGKSFSFKGSLKAHQLLHTGVKSFLCKFCGKAFHQKGEMKRHERKHTGEKPFICEVCGRAFAYRESLLGHSAVHTGVKPFPCKSCGMRFSCSGNLVKHRRSNNCKGFMEPGMEGVGIENSEENTSVNQSVPVVRPASVILDNSPKPPLSDCLRSDTQPLLNETQTSSNEVHDRSLEVVQSMVTQAHNQSPNQGVAVNNSSLTSSTLSITPMTDPRSINNDPMSISRNVSNIPMSVPRNASNVPLSEPRSVNNVQMPVCTSVNSSSLSASMSSPSSVDNHSLAVPHMASVIKSAPSINVKPTSALQGMPKESRQSAHVETPQSHGVTISTNNRPSGHLNTMYGSHENGVTVQSNYGSHNLTGSYNENQIRQSNQVNNNDRRFMQFSMDGYTGRADQYFDRQALMRHEMSRQAMERTADRSTSRFLDWTGGMQFSGMDSRNTLQSYPSAPISHSSGYPNIHSGHLGNYGASHTTGHSNNHANMYGGNTMMPGGVSFPAFAANNHIGMGYAPNNPIPAHSVAHSSSYPASHMSHLEALFGHFSHAGTGNSFPRLSSHSVGSPANPSLPSNNRV